MPRNGPNTPVWLYVVLYCCLLYTSTLRYDKSPSVRLAALNGLQPYVSQDQRVRDAVLESLMHDDSASVRTRAISLLPVSYTHLDVYKRQVLCNPLIRSIKQYPALQHPILVNRR